MPDTEVNTINLSNRHATRFIAILALYSYDMYKQGSLAQLAKKVKRSYLNKDIFDLEVSQDKLLEIELYAPDDQFLDQLMLLSEEKRPEIDKLIKDSLIEKWNIDKIDKVIKAILQLAGLELLYSSDTPAKVIIDEYVSLTKSFYENNEAGFVNKVIDSMARISRADEIG